VTPLFPPARFEPDAISRWLAEWLTAPAMRSLAEQCGWDLPWGAPPRELLDRWVDLATAWDFRRGAERHGLSWTDAEVDGHALADDLVVACARQLGFVDAMPVGKDVTHLVVLGGMVRAYGRRTAFARLLFEQAPCRPDVALLSGHRSLPENEQDDAEEAGWGRPTSEMDVARPALVTAFGLAGVAAVDETVEEGSSPPPAGLDGDEWRRRTCRVTSWTVPAPGRPEGCRFSVVVTPSGDPATRRTNTADHLAHWATLADVGPDDHVVLVTTAHYGPFQQLAALRLLAKEHGCEVVTTGAPWQPDGPNRGAGYLQEIRATLLEAQQLAAVLGPS
jgi:hypothetical protein